MTKKSDTHGFEFIGREPECAHLRALLPRPGSRARLQIVSGAAGIGKSRLVAEIAAHARQNGNRVLWGRCWDASITPPLWPWSQVARTLTGNQEPTDLATVLLSDSASDRFELFDALASCIRVATEEAPVVVILEDVHEADGPSILLADFLVQHLADCPLLIIMTFRTDDAAERPGLREQLSTLQLPEDWLRLSGLAEEDVRSVLTAPEQASDILSITGGNPLFIEYILRNGARSDPSPGTEEASTGEPGAGARSAAAQSALLRHITSRRLASLPVSTHAFVSGCALAGPQPTIQVVAELVGLSPDQAVAALQPALDSEILTLHRSRSTSSAPSIEFTHPLLAEAASTLAAPAVLQSVHLRRADMLRGLPGRHAERAHHLLQLGPDHSPDAVEACLGAAQDAHAAYAYDEAAGHIERALHTVDSVSLRSPKAKKTRLRLLVEYGIALRLAGRSEQARDVADTAWEQAVLAADGEAQARAALEGEFRFSFAGNERHVRAARCQAALDALPKKPSALRARLLAALSAARLSDDGEAQVLARESLAMAEFVGDPIAVGYALSAMTVTDLSPDSLEFRLRAAHRILAIARREKNQSLASHGYFFLLAALLEKGDIRALDAQLALADADGGPLADLADGRHAGWFRCTRALLDGRTDDAEQRANESYLAATRAGDPDAGDVWAAQIAIVRWLQGRVEEIEPLFLEARRQQPDVPVWSAALAWLWLRTGRSSAARGVLAEFGDLEHIPRDRNWLMTMATLAEVVAELGEDQRVLDLRESLLPYARNLVPIGLGVACWGTIARPLGLLARRLGRVDEARIHFDAAIEVSAQMGALPWLAEAQLDLAELELDELALAEVETASTPGGTDGGSERRRASQLIFEAEVTARTLGLRLLENRAAAHRSRLGPHQVSPVGPEQHHFARSAHSVPRISVLGTFEVRGTDGAVANWNSRKARELLKILLTRGGSPVAKDSLMDLLWPGEDSWTLGNRLAVAVSAVRRALDPGRRHSSEVYLATDGMTMSLSPSRLRVDAWEFLAEAQTVTEQVRSGGEPDLIELRRVVRLYRGDALPDEPYTDWALDFRLRCQSAFIEVSQHLATTAATQHAPLVAADACRGILDIDPLDRLAHTTLIAALKELGAHGQARAAADRYDQIRQTLITPSDQSAS
ncbi:AAA family ATPase [Homoserinimonas sp. OAct 916]|uniref:AAA family ATPase n=1 Tax=Homoserinimonas sp. OAct 916 TaxID=2211450 RepID=UPI0018E5823F|nr:AAA family ATPase [Homoserinimonas sp. OAct 916]